MPQLRTSFAAIWDDILPPLPEELWRANLAAVAGAARAAAERTSSVPYVEIGPSRARRRQPAVRSMASARSGIRPRRSRSARRGRGGPQRTGFPGRPGSSRARTRARGARVPGRRRAASPESSTPAAAPAGSAVRSRGRRCRSGRRGGRPAARAVGRLHGSRRRPRRRVRRDGAEHRHPQVDRQHDEHEGRRRAAARSSCRVARACQPASRPNAARPASARHAIGMNRSGTRVESRPGTRRQSVS